LLEKESALNILYSFPIVIIVSVFLLEVKFSTIENGEPGLTRVILKNVDPKSNPITLAFTATKSVKKAIIAASLPIWFKIMIN
jgi:hypothetical protein